MSADVERQRPSSARRKALKDADNIGGEKQGVPLVSNFFPIDRYYDAAEKVLHSFRRAFAAKQLDDAYVLGIRYASFSLEALPRHNYYNSSRYSKHKKNNQESLADVIGKLEQIAQMMDEEEIARERRRRKLEAERRRKLEEEERRKYEEFQRRVNNLKLHGKSSSSNVNVKQTALEKLKSQQSLLDQKNGIPPKQNQEEQPEEGESDNDPFMDDLIRSFRKRDDNSDDNNRRSFLERHQSESKIISSPGDRRGRKNGLYRPDSERSLTSRRQLEDGTGADPLPMPIPPPMPPPPPASDPPPPSYQSIASRNNQNLFPPRPEDQQKYVPPQLPALPAYANLDREREREKMRRARNEKVSVRKQREKAMKDFRSCKSNGRIEIMGIDTYQGRYNHSTNGCAVISPLVVSRHLHSRVAVSDSEIVDVIDRQCGPLLREIRSKLELGGHALIIPSDVHDHLIDKKLLSQESFVGATGGNIMDRKHVAEFLRLLDSGEKNSHKTLRTGGALFFREHVVSVVKVPAGNGKFYFDLIDSLPTTSGLGRSMATRTRCKDLGAFDSLIRHYASTKFSDANMNYIDRNEWDDSMADIDPRVFQGFVWGDPPKQ